jgi:2-deoxy-D-gluconate 3-dehydrogenase
MNYFNIKGKKAIVTGGSRGLGRGMAEGLMNQGVEVVLFATTPKIIEIAQEYRDKGFQCHGISVDIGNQAFRENAFHDAMELLGGKLDILVNAAGIQRRHKSEEFPLEDWNDVININLTSVFALCQLAAKEMMKEEKGKIINIASLLSFFGGYTVPAYAASKGGIAQLTKAFANEWAGYGINVNALAPGYMATEMNTALINDEGRNKEILARIPAKRWGTPEDMAGAALFLASPASDYVNGAVIPVDGGYLGR